MATQATASWVARKENDQGYHCATFASPVASWKTAAATSTPMETRSSPCTSSSRRGRGGRANSFG
ncbi:MAG: hypothetical protein R2731_02445 [Nocardioides sp.]